MSGFVLHYVIGVLVVSRLELKIWLEVVSSTLMHQSRKFFGYITEGFSKGLLSFALLKMSRLHL